MALNYGTSTSLACTSFNNLASSTTTGFASCAAATTSTTNNIVEAQVRVKVSVGAITPSASTFVALYVVGSEDGTAWPGADSTTEVFTAADEANTLSATSNNLKFLGTIQCHTASKIYTSEPLSIAAAFGGFLPRKWKVVIQNQTGIALAATNNAVYYTETYYN